MAWRQSWIIRGAPSGRRSREVVAFRSVGWVAWRGSEYRKLLCGCRWLDLVRNRYNNCPLPAGLRSNYAAVLTADLCIRIFLGWRAAPAGRSSGRTAARVERDRAHRIAAVRPAQRAAAAVSHPARTAGLARDSQP